MTVPIDAFAVDALTVKVYRSEAELALAAARDARDCLREQLAQKESGALVLATGSSQILFLNTLIHLEGVDWSRLNLFHLDEFLGIDDSHPGSFRYYLRERVERYVHPHQFFYIKGDAPEPLAECDRYAQLLLAQPLDLCCLGVGKNGHLAFNEPGLTDFNDPYQIKLVKLEDSTRLAQIGEGFSCLDAVPQYAFTLTIPMLCSAQTLFCLSPGWGKAKIVKQMLHSPISPDCAASVLRQQAKAILFLDADSASLL